MAEVGVKSKIVAPIVSLRDSGAPHLWGLLIVHACREYRQWQTSEAQFLQQLADQLAIAIQQAVLYEQLWQANQQLQHLATHDALTQVANRRTFNEHLNQEWLRLARERRPLALVFADIDYFKQYNDTYGHPAGDVCLTAVAQTLSQTLKRPADFIARYGGEEFVIVLPNTRAQGAVKLVQTLQTAIERLNFPHAGSALAAQRITLSFGIAWTIPRPTDAPQTLLERADQALYQAKNQGRDRYVLLAH
jgi:diguanylate cyclase (GGDEF)-like protein